MANGMEGVEEIKEELKKLKSDVVVGYNNMLQTFSKIYLLINKLNRLNPEEQASNIFFQNQNRRDHN